MDARTHPHVIINLFYITSLVERYRNKTSSLLLTDTRPSPHKQYNYHLLQILVHIHKACYGLILYSTKFQWGKTLANSLFRKGKCWQIYNRQLTLVNLEFDWVRIGEWHSVRQIHPSFPPPKFCTIWYHNIHPVCIIRTCIMIHMQ